uniref:Uncharacterized protein n=1 Tax=Cajanus cajan TaxID=3821 RepID=A0A151TWQ9_CAJCA|nr:hypothetical protein KK1_010782 [Cajanus cajan]
MRPITTHWDCPFGGCYKLNCDGVVSEGIASCGGVIHDYFRSFVVGFSCNLGSCSML